MVFDHASKYLYISCSDGVVRRYNLTNGQLDAPYNLGGTLNGLDIAPDDSSLLIAQNTIAPGTGTIQKIDLGTGAITNFDYKLGFLELGPWDIAFAQNGLAFFSSQFNGSGPTRLRQFDLATNAITFRPDVPDGQIDQSTQIARSADGSLLLFLEGNESRGPFFTYRADKDAFSPVSLYRWFLYHTSSAISRDGSLLATRKASSISLENSSTLEFERSFQGFDSGVAFDATRNVLYAVDSAADQIVAFDTTKFSRVSQFAIGEDIPSGSDPFETGTLVASADGRYLALSTPSGVRLVSIPSPLPPPAPTPVPTLSTRRSMVFDHAGANLYVTTSAGLIERYALATGKIDKVFDLGGVLNAIDISTDDSILLVAQGNYGLVQGTFHRIDLQTDGITDIQYARVGGEDGAWEVAIAANGLAFGTTHYDGSGQPVQLRQIDLATNTLTQRADAPGSRTPGWVAQDTKVRRSGDGKRLFFLEGNYSDGIFLYDSTSDSFGAARESGRVADFCAAAVNQDGSLVGTRLSNYASIDGASDFDLRQLFAGIDSGVAFDAAGNFYGVNSSTGQIICYGPSFSERWRMSIGEAMPANNRPFEAGSLAAASNGQYLALTTPTTLRVYPVPSPSPAPTPASTPAFIGTARGMIFDNASRYLYITTAEGLVQRYDLAARDLLLPFDAHGSLNGIEIAPDDSFLLLAQNDIGLTQAAVEKMDTATGATSLTNFDRVPGEGGMWDLSLASNGKAFLTTSFLFGGGTPPLRQLDVVTNAITIRTDEPPEGFHGEIQVDTKLARSADRSRIYFLYSDDSTGPYFCYNGLSDTFGPKFLAQGSWDYGSGAVSRDGSLFAYRTYQSGANLNSSPDNTLLHAFPDINNAVVVDAVADTICGVTSTNEIVGYDTNTYTEKLRFPTGTQLGSTSYEFGAGTLVASKDGRYLALMTFNDVRLFDLTTLPVTPTIIAGPTPTPTPTPVPTPTPGPTPIISISASPALVSEGATSTITVAASVKSNVNVNISYTIGGSARFGADYTTSAGVNQNGLFTIPAGQTSASITITALADSLKEKKETIVMSLSPGSGYSFGASAKKKKPKLPSATVTIAASK
jgi:hypothetical protein